MAGRDSGAVSSSIVCHTRAKMGVLSLVWHNLCHRMKLESMSWQLVVSRYHWKMAETVCCR